MAKKFLALLLIGPLVLSGCTDMEVQVAEPTVQIQESPLDQATTSPEPNPIPASKLQDCKFNGDRKSVV